MKKILLTLLLLIPSIVLADNNVVTIDASFDEDVDYYSINDIQVLYTDMSEEEYSITLTRENNYHYSYDLYDGSDILKVNAILNNDELSYETSVEKLDNGYLIHINIIKKEKSEYIKDNNTSEDIVINESTTTTTTKVNTTTTKVTTTKKIEFTEEETNNFIRIIFIISMCILGIFVLLFIGYATIKIVNANK